MSRMKKTLYFLLILFSAISTGILGDAAMTHTLPNLVDIIGSIALSPISIPMCTKHLPIAIPAWILNIIGLLFWPFFILSCVVFFREFNKINSIALYLIGVLGFWGIATKYWALMSI